MAWESVALNGRPYILIETKQVCRVVLVFQFDKSLVIPAVSAGDPAGLLCVKVVHVDLTARKWLDGGPEFPCPLDLPSRLGGIHPLRDNIVIPLVITET